MRREFYVRFCEGGGVRFPSATRPAMVGFREHEFAAAAPKPYGLQTLGAALERAVATPSIPLERAS